MSHRYENLIVTTNVKFRHGERHRRKTVGGRPAQVVRRELREADWNETVIAACGNGSEDLNVSPDGKEILGWPMPGRELSPSSICGKQVTQTLAPDVSTANRLKVFTPDGKLALISALRGADVTVIDAATRKTIKRYCLLDTARPALSCNRTARARL